jgi:hypothetical protein
MVGSGLILWTVKRRARLPDPDRPHFGFRLVEKLNVAAIVGLPFGIAAYFLANRLIPLGIAGRADREIAWFFIAWGAVAVWSIARPARRAWLEGLVAVALAFAAVPLVDAFTTGRSLAASLMTGDMVFAGFDIAMLAIAAGFGWAAVKVARQGQGQAAPRRLARSAAAASGAEAA